MLTMLRMFLLALVLLPASSVSAQQVSDGDRFNLYASCAQMHPSLGRRASAWWDEVGLTENAVFRAVNSRLRAARLYNERSLSPMLGINVFVIPDHRFRVTVSLAKVLLDEDSGIRLPRQTWERWRESEVTTTTEILGAVAELMDLFIDEYLRVNADACTQTTPQ